MQLGWSAVESSFRIRWIARVAAVLYLLAYIFVYWKEPFPEVWNTIILYAFLVLVAGLTAVMSTMIWSRYDKTDVPRQIWLCFSIGLWLWTAAEFTYGYVDVTRGEVVIGLQDVFWIAAYLFFAIGLGIQYRILTQPSNKELAQHILAAIGILLVLYTFVYWLVAHSANAAGRLDTAVNSFYPVGDLFLGAVALWLVSHFRGGAFARPWLGLLAFSFTDILYAWLETFGLYDKAPAWTVLFDTTYIGAYLLLGLGLLSLWIFLKYGLRSPV